MLNKNDPLIGAVQQVMQQSNAEREATRLVNEAFGVEDRKALPHEYQAEWNSVYQQVLAEGVEALDEIKRSTARKAEKESKRRAEDPSLEDDNPDLPGRRSNRDSQWQNIRRMRIKKLQKEEALDESDIDHPNKRKLDVAPPYGHLTKKDFSTLRAMGEEEQLDEKTIAKKKAKKGTKYKVQATNSDREGSKITLRHGKRIKDEGDYDRGARAFFMKTGTYGSAEDMLKTVKEEIAYNLAEQAEYVYENYGEEGLVEFINSLTEEQFELLSMLESAGLPGAAVDYFQKKAKREAAQKSSQNKGSDPTNTSGGMRAGAVAPRGSDPTNTDSGQRAGAAQPKPPKPKAKPVTAAPKASAPKAAAPKAAAPKVAAQPKKKLTFFQKSELARSRKNDTMDQTRNLERRYGVREPMRRAKKSIFREHIENLIAERVGGGKSPAAQSIQQQKNAVIQKRQNMAQSVQAGRVGDPGRQNFIQNARAEAQRRRNANQPVLKAKEVFKDPKTAAAMQQGSDDIMRNVKRQEINKVMADRQKARVGVGNDRRKTASDFNIGNPMGDYNPGQENSTPTTPKSQAQLNTTPTIKTRPELPKAAPKVPSSQQKPIASQQTVKKGDTMWGYAKQDIKQSRNLAASGPLGGNAFGGNAGTSGAELVKRKITNKDIAAKTEKIKALNPTVNPRKMQIGSTIKTN